MLNLVEPGDSSRQEFAKRSLALVRIHHRLLELKALALALASMTGYMVAEVQIANVVGDGHPVAEEVWLGFVADNTAEFEVSWHLGVGDVAGEGEEVVVVVAVVGDSAARVSSEWAVYIAAGEHNGHALVVALEGYMRLQSLFEIPPEEVLRDYSYPIEAPAAQEGSAEVASVELVAGDSIAAADIAGVEPELRIVAVVVVAVDHR